MPVTLPLFLAVDGRHACLLAPMMMSVLEHAHDRIAFHVLGDGIPSGVAEALDAMVRRHDRATISFHDAAVPSGAIEGCSRGWFRNDIVFARLWIPDRFPGVDRAIYMDVDTLALGDIGGIMESGGDGEHGIAAAPDMGLRSYVNESRHRRRLGLPEEHVFFNNGVMLIDCRWWRSERALSSILSIARACRRRVRFPTQDPMNVFFSPNRYARLSTRYNCMPFWGRPPADALVIHFTGEKPWEDSALPSANLFRHYADRGPCAEAIRDLGRRGSLLRSLRRAWRCGARTLRRFGNSLSSGCIDHG